jgi:signal transduction histidine kinase
MGGVARRRREPDWRRGHGSVTAWMPGNRQNLLVRVILPSPAFLVAIDRNRRLASGPFLSLTSRAKGNEAHYMTRTRYRKIPRWMLGTTLPLLIELALLHPAMAFTGQDPSVYEYKDTRDLVAMVNEAAELFAQKGEEAYQELGRRGSRWLLGERYIFTYDLNGVCVFHPEDPQLVGKNLSDLKDVLGKPMIQWILEIAASPSKPYGWVHYLWPAPNSLFSLWKSAYIVGVRSPQGKLYALGSGLYNMRVEKSFIVDLVDRAADLIDRKGEAAFSTLRDTADRYNLYGTYVYVFSTSGELKVDPAFPPGEERNALDYKDAVGRYFIRDAIDQIKEKQTAWVLYMWPRPGEGTLSKKLMYARRVQVGDETYLVGSDMYLSPPIWLHF